MPADSLDIQLVIQPSSLHLWHFKACKHSLTSSCAFLSVSFKRSPSNQCRYKKFKKSFFRIVMWTFWNMKCRYWKLAAHMKLSLDIQFYLFFCFSVFSLNPAIFQPSFCFSRLSRHTNKSNKCVSYAHEKMSFWYCTSFIPNEDSGTNMISRDEQCNRGRLQDMNEIQKKTHSFGGSTNILDDHFSLFVEVFVSQRSFLFFTQVHVLLMKEHKMITFRSLFSAVEGKAIAIVQQIQIYHHFFKKSQYLFFRRDLGRQLFKLIWGGWWR